MHVTGHLPFSGFEQSVAHDDLNSGRFAVYDDPEVWAAFSQPVDKHSQAQVFQSFVAVKGMSCAACALTLETALGCVKGVLAVQVSAASARASVTWSAAQTQPSSWLNAGLANGYQLLPADDAVSIEGDRQQSRLVLWRWLVAGFCMMQVMMYAAPTYFTQPGDITPDIEKLLRWASWVLSLPVVLFSCRPFFSNAWRDLMRRSISMDLPVAIGIGVTFVVSTAATFEPQGWWGRAVYFDSLTMFVFFLLTGRWLEQRLSSRTAGALGALMQRMPAGVQRQRPDGGFEHVASRRLCLGDVVRVLPGEAFSADATVLSVGVLADEALLTGESKPVTRDRGDSVLAGSYNVGSTALVRVDKLGLDTRYAQMVALMARASLDKPRLALLADKVAKPFLWLVLLAAAGAAAFWWRTDPAMALMAAVAVLVVTCPCALSLATPTALLTTAGFLARHGVLVRRLQAIESLDAIDTVIFDKTGTLTEATMHLEAVQTRSGVSGNQALQWAAGLARHSLHPVSRALASAAEHLPALDVSNVKEFAGLGLEALCDESHPHAEGWSGVLRLGSRSFCRVNGNLNDSHLNNANDAIDADMTVGRVHLADSQGWLATFELTESLRRDAGAAVAALQARGLAVHLLSGDSLTATRRVAGQLGIQNVQGDCLPHSKLAFMQALQAQGHTVLMVGDGLNDGPTLAAADVSVAVGAAVPLAQAQSDLVLPGAQLLMLPIMLDQSRRTLKIVKQNLAWAAVYNAIGVPLAVGGFLPAWLAGLGMALSSLLVVLNAARLSRFKTDA
jgi:Cu2+-exporting ATPase